MIKLICCACGKELIKDSSYAGSYIGVYYKCAICNYMIEVSLS